jgi:hypothetical protein
MPHGLPPIASRTGWRDANLDLRRLWYHLIHVGPHRSRPAPSRHIAQALHLAHTSGRGLLAICRSPAGPVPAAAMEKSMSGPMQSPGRFKAFCPSSAHAPFRRAARYRQRLTAVRRQQMSTLFRNPPGTFAEYENSRSPAADPLRDNHLVLLTINRPAGTARGVQEMAQTQKDGAGPCRSR